MTNATETTDTATKVHPFEAAGLGLAPFRFVGMDRKVGPIIWVENGITLQAGAPGQPMGTCDFCGTGIADCCQIVSADGKHFVVGTTCVEKTHAKGARILTQVQAAAREMKRTAQKVKDLTRIAAAKALLPTVVDQLQAQPHPNAYFAAQGKTLADWVGYMFENAGTSGRIEACRVVERYA